MSLKRGLLPALPTLLVSVSALIMAVLVNLGGGELADTIGFPARVSQIGLRPELGLQCDATRVRWVNCS